MFTERYLCVFTRTCGMRQGERVTLSYEACCQARPGQGTPGDIGQKAGDGTKCHGLWIVVAAVVLYLLITLVLTYLCCNCRGTRFRCPDWEGSRISESPEGGSTWRSGVWNRRPVRVWSSSPMGGEEPGRMVDTGKNLRRHGIHHGHATAPETTASSRHRYMNAPRFADDIESVMTWVGEPVLLYGHSIARQPL